MFSKQNSLTDKIPFYFSVDFEDLYFDAQRKLGNPCPNFKLNAVKKVTK